LIFYFSQFYAKTFEHTSCTTHSNYQNELVKTIKTM